MCIRDSDGPQLYGFTVGKDTTARNGRMFSLYMNNGIINHFTVDTYGGGSGTGGGFMFLAGDGNDIGYGLVINPATQGGCAGYRDLGSPAPVAGNHLHDMVIFSGDAAGQVSISADSSSVFFDFSSANTRFTNCVLWSHDAEMILLGMGQQDTAVSNIGLSAPASPLVVTWPSAQSFVADQSMTFSSTGTLPAPLEQGVRYYILAAGLTATTCRVSLTKGGAPIATTAPGSGTFSARVGATPMTASITGATVTNCTGGTYKGRGISIACGSSVGEIVASLTDIVCDCSADISAGTGFDLHGDEGYARVTATRLTLISPFKRALQAKGLWELDATDCVWGAPRNGTTPTIIVEGGGLTLTGGSVACGGGHGIMCGSGGAGGVAAVSPVITNVTVTGTKNGFFAINLNQVDGATVTGCVTTPDPGATTAQGIRFARLNDDAGRPGATNCTATGNDVSAMPDPPEAPCIQFSYGQGNVANDNVGSPDCTAAPACQAA